MTIKTERDMTKPLTMFTELKLEVLETADLSGYIFKKDSPSCGIERVRVFNQHGMPSRTGVGLFAQAFMERFPLIPIEEEGRLAIPYCATILSSGCFVTTAGSCSHGDL